MHFIVNCVAEASISVYFFHVCYGSIYLMIDKWPSSIVDDKRTHTFLRVVFVMQINTGTNWDHHCNITTGKTVMSCSTKPIFLCKRFSNKPHWVTTIVPQSVPTPALLQYCINATQIKTEPPFYSIWRLIVELVQVAVVWCCLYRPCHN